MVCYLFSLHKNKLLYHGQICMHSLRIRLRSGRRRSGRRHSSGNSVWRPPWRLGVPGMRSGSRTLRERKIRSLLIKGVKYRYGLHSGPPRLAEQEQRDMLHSLAVALNVLFRPTLLTMDHKKKQKHKKEKNISCRGWESIGIHGTGHNLWPVQKAETLIQYASCLYWTTGKISKQLQLDIDKHNAQYPLIEVRTFSKAHDRFLIIDDAVYLVGASIKDLGKKWFGFTLMENTDAEDLMGKI